MTMPQRAPRVTEEQAEQIVRLAIQQVSQAEIAREVGVHRQTVKRVLDRTRTTLAVTENTEQDRAEAVAVLREVQRTAWEDAKKARESGRSTSSLLAEVRLCQQQINGLLGLAALEAEDPVLILARFKAVVADVIRAEALDLAPKIAQRLLEQKEK